MKKIILFILLLLPMFVYAEECNNDVSIEKIELIKVEGKATEISEAKIEDQIVNFDIKFSKLNDSVEYKLLIKNNGKEDYQIDKNSIKSESKNISYVLNYGKSSVIEAGKEKEISLIVKYDKQIDNSLFVNNEYELKNEMSFSLVNNKQPNPLTRGNVIIEFIVIVGAWIVILIAINSNKKTVATVGVLLLFVPFIVNALCTMTIKTSSHFVIEKVPVKRCTFEGELTKGAEFEDDIYIYKYLQEAHPNGWNDIDEGWGVRLKNLDSTEPVTEGFCTFINDIPVTSMRYIFANSKTSRIDLREFNTSHIKSMMQLFVNDEIYDLDFSTLDTSSVENMKSMFVYLKTNDLDLRNLDTSKVTNMSTMFVLSDIDSVNMSGLDTSKVTTMYEMFNEAKIKHLDVSNLNNDNVTNMAQLFYQFEGEVDLTNFGTPSATTMSYMFGETNIPYLNLSSFDTSNVTDMQYMFWRSNTKQDLDLTSFNTLKLENMNAMFMDSKFTTVDLSSFDTRNVVEMGNLFYELPYLTTVYASYDFVQDSVVYSDKTEFHFTPLLRGGKGTVCDNVNTTPHLLYARIDNAPESPGCFTLKR